MFKRLANSFKYAARGIWFCISHEMNMRIHIVATMCVLYLSQFYNFTKEQFVLLIITCVTVISAEMMNTAIEVVSEEVNVGDSTEANTQDERTIPIDVDQTEEVVDSDSDIVEVKKSKSVSLSIKTNKTQYKKVSLK